MGKRVDVKVALCALYTALRNHEHGKYRPSNVGVGVLNAHLSALFLDVEGALHVVAARDAQREAMEEDMVRAALFATTEDLPESVQYVLIRGLAAMGWALPIEASWDVMRAALQAAAATATALAARQDAGTLRPLLEALTKDFGLDPTDTDDEPVGGSIEGPMSLTFGMIRSLRDFLEAGSPKSGPTPTGAREGGG